jgi:hypothetical protein
MKIVARHATIFIPAAALLLAVMMDVSTAALAFPTRGRPREDLHPHMASANYRIIPAKDPDRTIVQRPDGQVVATFTRGARTVSLAGPRRVFSEPSAAHPVVSHIYVRLLPEPFEGKVDTSWLERALADRSPDILGLGMQYASGAPPIYEGERKIAGDAGYGPWEKLNRRQEGSDFNDYLGLAWEYDGRTDRPEPGQKGCLDCSGFIRMVFGYRAKMPLSRKESPRSLPRRAVQMARLSPGVVIRLYRL